MISSYIKFSKKPFNAFLQIIIFFLFLPFLISFFLGDTLTERFIYFTLSILTITFACEFAFLLFHKLYAGVHYKFIVKIDFKKLFHQPHPYLPFTYKKNFDGGRAEQVNYPLHPNLSSPILTTNNLGFFNGESGNRNVLLPKPKNLIRINCIGGSTTGNYIKADRSYSYPLELERILKKNSDKNIEVNNFGHGGYNSADVFVSFALQSIDTNPDYVIIYHAYNDVRAYLSPGFSSDYSHSRKNLGEVYWKYRVASKFPNIPINFINYLTNKFLFSASEQYSILEVIEKSKIDMSLDYFNGLKTYERNLQHIIHLCLCNNIKVILSTFCIYLYPSIKNDPINRLYQKIVSEENEVMKRLAKKNNLTLVDAASSISRENANFVDSSHFTPQGMTLLAQCFAEKIYLE